MNFPWSINDSSLMDPLSITASVVGLKIVAGQIKPILYDFMSSSHDTPSLIRSIRSEVRAISSALANLQKLLSEDTRRSKSRKAMITVEHLVVTLTGCVHTFSELQEEINNLRCSYDMKVMNVTRWFTREEVISQLFKRLQVHKSLLDMVLIILGGELKEDADRSLERLRTLANRQMENQKDMLIRLRKLEATIAQSTKKQHLYALQPPTAPGVSRSQTMRLESSNFFGLDVDLQPPRVSKRSFWKTWKLGSLRESRAYLAVEKRTRWSYLSGVSLADVTYGSALVLPIYFFDISNSECYSFDATFDSISDDLMSETTSLFSSPCTTPSPPSTPAPHLGRLLEQMKSTDWQSSAKEPHPNLSLSNNPKELEIFLNELWASAYIGHVQ